MSGVSPSSGLPGTISLFFLIFSAASEAKADDGVKKRRKKSARTLSVTSMLKKFQREKEKLERVQKEAAAPTIPLCPADAAGGGGSGLTDPLLSLIGSTNEQALIQAASAVDLDIDLDSLLEASEGTAVPQPAADPQLLLSKAADFPPAPPPDARLQLKPHPVQTSTASPHQFVCLPDGVPAGLAAAIQRLAVVRLVLFVGFRLDTPRMQMMCCHLSGCQDVGGGIKTQVLHTGNQLHPAGVSSPANIWSLR